MFFLKDLIVKRKFTNQINDVKHIVVPKFLEFSVQQLLKKVGNGAEVLSFLKCHPQLEVAGSEICIQYFKHNPDLIPNKSFARTLNVQV